MIIMMTAVDCYLIVMMTAALVVNIILIIFIVVITISFYTIHFKCGVRHHWRCRGRVVMIILMTAGDAEDAS